MPIFELTLQCSYYGQTIINRWNYLGTGTPAATSLSYGLGKATGFQQDTASTVFPVGTMAAALRATQRSELTYIQFMARDVYSVTDYWETPMNAGTTGGLTGAGTSLSPISSMGYKSSRPRLDIGRGYKRFPGLERGNIAGGGVIASAFLTGVMTDLANAMGQTISFDDSGSILTYTPIVVKKQPYPTESGNTAYRYYPTAAEQLQYIAEGVTWTPYTTVRSQTSRQYGHGS